MHKTTLTRLSLLLVFFLESFASFQNTNSDKIPWIKDAKLKWKDFLGEPPKDSPHQAITTYRIAYSYTYDKNGIKMNVSCYFIKNKSWVGDSVLNSSLVLKHEQGHFDIAEKYARLFRKRLSEFSFKYSMIDAEILKIHDAIMKECDVEEDLYDNETDHSKINTKQNSWNKKTEVELKNLNAFEQCEFIIAVKND